MFRRSCSHICGGKEILFTYSEGVYSALDIQQATRICHIVSAFFTALQYCPHYLTKSTIHEKQFIKMFVVIESTYLIWYISHSKKNWRRYYYQYTMFSCKVQFIVVRLLWILNFLEKLSRYFEIFNFIKIPPVGSYLLHAERRSPSILCGKFKLIAGPPYCINIYN